MPRFPVQSGEIKKYRDWRKYRIIESNKWRESAVENKVQHVALEYVHIKKSSIQAVDSSRERYDAMEHVRIQRMSIQAEDLSRTRHAALESVCIQDWLIDLWLITTYYVNLIFRNWQSTMSERRLGWHRVKTICGIFILS